MGAMSMVLTRSPLEPIGMNGAGVVAPKRRSARLSAEGADENADDGFAPTVRKGKGTATTTTTTTTVGTKERDGGLEGAGAGAKRKKRGEMNLLCFALRRLWRRWRMWED